MQVPEQRAAGLTVVISNEYPFFFLKWSVLFRFYILVRYRISVVLYKFYCHLCKREAVVWRWWCVCGCNFWWL